MGTEGSCTGTADVVLEPVIHTFAIGELISTVGTPIQDRLVCAWFDGVVRWACVFFADDMSSERMPKLTIALDVENADLGLVVRDGLIQKLLDQMTMGFGLVSPARGGIEVDLHQQLGSLAVHYFFPLLALPADLSSGRILGLVVRRFFDSLGLLTRPCTLRRLVRLTSPMVMPLRSW